jgi:hypothetical protein
MVSGLLAKTEKVTVDFGGATSRHAFPVVPVAAAVVVVILLALAALFLTRSRRTMRARTS